MKKITSIFAVGICLLAVACAKAEPKASTITRSEITAAQLINANDDLGQIAVYFEEIDLKTKAYATTYRGCMPLVKDVDLTAPYTQTIRAGFKQGFANVEFVSAPMSTQEMKAKNIQAQIQLKKPTVLIEYHVKENFLMTDFKAFATLKGTLFVNNQTGALQQKNLSITKSDEVSGTFIPDCDRELAPLIENAATEAIKQFALKNISTSKDIIRIQNSQK